MSPLLQDWKSFHHAGLLEFLVVEIWEPFPVEVKDLQKTLQADYTIEKHYLPTWTIHQR